MKSYLIKGSKIGFLLLAIMACVAIVQVPHWFLQLFTHLMFQISVGLAVFSLLFGLIGERKLALFALLLCIPTIFYQWNGPHASTNSPLTKAQITLQSINVLSNNSQFDKVQSYITQSDPDILVITEFSSPWKTNLNLHNYPYSIESVRNDNFGIALFSKLPLTEKKILHLGEKRFPVVKASVSFKNQLTTIVGVHLENPMGSQSMSLQNIQLDQLFDMLDPLPSIVLAGDMNLTSYTRQFRKLKRKLKLVDSRKGFQRQASWPTLLPAILRIPIDHVLVSKDIEIEHRSLGPNIGSDHLPVLIRLGK